MKINILREKFGLPKIPATSLQPTLEINPSLTFEQTERILLELRLFKMHMGIKKLAKTKKESGLKSSTDVYNKLLLASRDIDLINGFSFTSSFTFSESMRIFEDITTIMNALNIKDDVRPPKKIVDATSKESYKVAINLLKEIQRSQISANIKTISLDEFLNIENPTISDVFMMTELILAEVQTLKVHLGLKNSITPLALYFENKNSADVAQLLGWLVRKFQKIEYINKR